MSNSSKGKKPQRETSPGGSVINRYQKEDWQPTRVGLPDDSAAAFDEAPQAVYGRFSGAALTVSHEVPPLIPHADVFAYGRRGKDGREVCTLVTSGMSDLEVNIPAGTGAPRRVGLIFQCREPKPEYIEIMRWLAHFAHDQRTWVGAGHTVPNGNPPVPFWGSPILDTILFVPPIVKRDATLPDTRLTSERDQAPQAD